MSRSKRAAAGFSTAILQYGVQIVLQAALAPLILRYGGASTLGAYATIMQVMGYGVLLDLGFSQAMNRYLAQTHGAGTSSTRFRDVLTTGRTFLLASNLLYGAFVASLAFAAGSLFHLPPPIRRDAQIGLLLFSVWCVARTGWGGFSAALVASQRMATANFLAILQNTLRLALSVALVAPQFGITRLIIAAVLAEAATSFLAKRTFCRAHPDRVPSWGFRHPDLFREMFLFGIQVFPALLATQLIFQSSYVIVTSVCGVAAVASYYVTQMPAVMGYNIVNRLSDSAAPAINELYGSRDMTAFAAAFRQVYRYTCFLSFPLAAGVIVLNRTLVTAWVGERQYAGPLMTAALAGFALTVSLGHVPVIGLIAMGRVRILSMLAIAEGVVNVALSIAFGRWFGVQGVMLAIFIANVPGCVAVHFLVCRYLKLAAVRTILEPAIRTALAATLAALGTAVVLLFLPERPVLRLLLGCAAFSAFYLLACLLTVLREQDRQLVRTLLPEFFFATQN
jgi:O-antigen/teichoic acid export membrane protein